VYVRLSREPTAQDVQETFESFYREDPFVRVLPAGEQPRTKDVLMTHYCDVGVTFVPPGRAVVTTAIDNLSRGASSQAVQNMNVACGLEEGMGLR
jgi:N-acetyl-gamma-glutamyl-phosphate reductase